MAIDTTSYQYVDNALKQAFTFYDLDTAVLDGDYKLYEHATTSNTLESIKDSLAKVRLGFTQGNIAVTQEGEFKVLLEKGGEDWFVFRELKAKDIKNFATKGSGANEKQATNLLNSHIAGLSKDKAMSASDIEELSISVYKRLQLIFSLFFQLT